jgi:peroxiredoxin
MKYILFAFTLLFSSQIIGQKSISSLKLKTLDGKSVDLKEIAKGKNTIISFWALWCAPCKKELTAIAPIYEKWQKEFDAELIAVSIDDSRSVARVKPFVEQKGWKYTILSDTNQSSMQSLHFFSIPQTYIVNAKGEIIYEHSGYSAGTELEMEEVLEKLVSK